MDTAHGTPFSRDIFAVLMDDARFTGINDSGCREVDAQASLRVNETNSVDIRYL